MSISNKQSTEKAGHLSEWHEDFGPVLWWRFPVNEPPYVGTPLDCGYTVQVDIAVRTYTKAAKRTVTTDVGGWPGYHTHWTAIELPEEPA
jgi:hypothetical protein